MPRLKHGLHGSRIYKIWQGMKTRCLNKNDPNYKRWGAKGISICHDWLTFQIFYAWAVNNGYAAQLTLDRIDNDLGYTPENCRWTTQIVQFRNKKANILNMEKAEEIREKIKTGSRNKDLAVEYGCSVQTICDVKKHRIWRQE